MSIASLFVQLATAPIQQIFGSQCIHCSTKPTTNYIRSRCILWSL